MKSQLESKLQQQCVRWFKYQYPHDVIASFPNEGKRTIGSALRMKAEGLRAGMPDLFIAVMRGGYGGLFIEMKYGKEKPTDLQEATHSDLRAAGYDVQVCRSFEAFMILVKEYLLTK
jgi:hypothetical protein